MKEVNRYLKLIFILKYFLVECYNLLCVISVNSFMSEIYILLLIQKELNDLNINECFFYINTCPCQITSTINKNNKYIFLSNYIVQLTIMFPMFINLNHNIMPVSMRNFVYMCVCVCRSVQMAQLFRRETSFEPPCSGFTLVQFPVNVKRGMTRSSTMK